jgi:membrane fusion protein (multidrug efflux system)
MAFPVTIDALGDQTFFGDKHFLSRKADTNARLYALEVALDNADGRILPGMFARVEITRAQDPSGIAVPIYAIIKKNENKIVFVENEGVAQERRV